MLILSKRTGAPLIMTGICQLRYFVSLPLDMINPSLIESPIEEYADLQSFIPSFMFMTIWKSMKEDIFMSIDNSFKIFASMSLVNR